MPIRRKKIRNVLRFRFETSIFLSLVADQDNTVRNCIFAFFKYVRRNWLPAIALSLTLVTTFLDESIYNMSQNVSKEDCVRFAMALYAFAAPVWIWYHVTHPLSFVWNEISFCYLPRKVVVDSSHNRDNLMLLFTFVHTIASTIYLTSYYHERSIHSRFAEPGLAESFSSKASSFLWYDNCFPFLCWSTRNTRSELARIIAKTIAEVHYNESAPGRVSCGGLHENSNPESSAVGFWLSVFADFGAIMLGFATIALLKASTAILCSPIENQKNNLPQGSDSEEIGSKASSDSNWLQNGSNKGEGKRKSGRRRKSANKLKVCERDNHSHQKERVQHRSEPDGESNLTENNDTKKDNYNSLKECTTFGTVAIWIGYVCTFSSVLFSCEASECQIRFGFLLPLGIFVLMPMVQLLYVLYECGRTYTTFMRLAGFLTLTLMLMSANAVRSCTLAYTVYTASAPQVLESYDGGVYIPRQSVDVPDHGYRTSGNANVGAYFHSYHRDYEKDVNLDTSLGIHHLSSDEISDVVYASDKEIDTEDNGGIIKDSTSHSNNEKRRGTPKTEKEIFENYENATEIIYVPETYYSQETNRSNEIKTYFETGSNFAKIDDMEDENDFVSNEDVNVTMKHINDVPFPGSKGFSFFFKQNVQSNDPEDIGPSPTIFDNIRIGRNDQGKKERGDPFRIYHHSSGAKQRTLYFI